MKELELNEWMNFIEVFEWMIEYVVWWFFGIIYFIVGVIYEVNEWKSFVNRENIRIWIYYGIIVLWNRNYWWVFMLMVIL